MELFFLLFFVFFSLFSKCEEMDDDNNNDNNDDDDDDNSTSKSSSISLMVVQTNACLYFLGREFDLAGDVDDLRNQTTSRLTVRVCSQMIVFVSLPSNIFIY